MPVVLEKFEKRKGGGGKRSSQYPWADWLLVGKVQRFSRGQKQDGVIIQSGDFYCNCKSFVQAAYAAARYLGRKIQVSMNVEGGYVDINTVS